MEFAKQQKGVKTANFVNAVLRRFIREREGLIYPEDPVRKLSITHSFPLWLVEKWSTRFGIADTERLLSILNEPPRFTIRINTEKISKEEVVSELEVLGVETLPGRFVDSALRVDKLGPVLACRLFHEKLISIQDEASQLVASALEAGKGDIILDACAGLGTKTGQLRELAPGPVIVAMDNDVGRPRTHPGRSKYCGRRRIEGPVQKGTIRHYTRGCPVFLPWHHKEASGN